MSCNTKLPLNFTLCKFYFYSVLPHGILTNNKNTHLLLQFQTILLRISISVLNSISAEIQWDLPPFEDQNGVIEFYRLFVIEVDTGRVIEQFRSENASIMLQEL